MPTPVEIVEGFMATFIEAWPTKNASDLQGFFSQDAVYHNIPLEAVRGRDAIRATLEGFMELGGEVEVDVSNVVADGDLVVVERVDHFIDSSGRRSLPIMGIFEIRDGVISAWRDYFDLSELR
jgi:limonene-1,2-epoxide hydrolase